MDCFELWKQAFIDEFLRNLIEIQQNRKEAMEKRRKEREEVMEKRRKEIVKAMEKRRKEREEAMEKLREYTD